MKMATKGRVAIAAILDIAIHGTDKPVSLTGISERQCVSVSYLEQLFQKLRQKGFVASHRGPGGGYRLLRDLATVSVADVIAAVDGQTLERNPHGGNSCGDKFVSGVTNDLWCRVNDQLQDYLSSVTMASVLVGARNAANAREPVVAAMPLSSFARTPLWQEDRPAAAMG